MFHLKNMPKNILTDVQFVVDVVDLLLQVSARWLFSGIQFRCALCAASSSSSHRHGGRRVRRSTGFFSIYTSGHSAWMSDWVDS